MPRVSGGAISDTQRRFAYWKRPKAVSDQNSDFEPMSRECILRITHGTLITPMVAQTP
jgi:hypothetical protein